MLIYEIFKVILFGIVEGVTEWLPISSTGHMILLDELIHLDVSDEFLSMLLVVIQLGAIFAVVVLFLDKLNPFSKKLSQKDREQRWHVWGKVAVSSLPAAILGFAFDDLFDKYFYNYFVVALALIIYGIIFIFIEKSRAECVKTIDSLDNMTYFDALKIGAFQSLSLIPGTSRSGSTIIGGMLIGASREVSAEFSFFMAIPIMLGASMLKIIKFLMAGFSVTTEEIILLFIGILVSFAVSIVVIRFLMDYIKRHNFTIFGIYRIVLGIIVLIYFAIQP